MYFYGVNIHEKYMSRCIALAKKGLGTTYPNPMVGSILVIDDKIVGEGFHYKAGQPHAEVNAIASASEASFINDVNFTNATIYVTLEPCSHVGKTPPCADLIIEKGIKNVIIGSTDPNPKVAGRGIEKLIKAGCDVIVGVLAEECDALNKRFFTFHKKNRPFIILKWAQTQNGFIAPKISERTENKPVWITNEFSRQRVHKMRAEEQAILVGTNTVLADNPSLTTRDWDGNSPTRVVIDKELKIVKNASVLDGKFKTIVFTEKPSENKENLFYEIIDFSEDILPQLLNVLYRYEIQSLIVEGGSQTLQYFIDAGLWDEAHVFTGNITFKNGIAAPTFSAELISEEKIINDTLRIYANN